MSNQIRMGKTEEVATDLHGWFPRITRLRPRRATTWRARIGANDSVFRISLLTSDCRPLRHRTKSPLSDLRDVGGRLILSDFLRLPLRLWTDSPWRGFLVQSSDSLRHRFCRLTRLRLWQAAGWHARITRMKEGRCFPMREIRAIRG